MDQAHILSILFLKMYYLFAGQTFLFELFCLFFEDVSLRDPCIRNITEDAGFDSSSMKKTEIPFFLFYYYYYRLFTAKASLIFLQFFSELEIHV